MLLDRVHKLEENTRITPILDEEVKNYQRFCVGANQIIQTATEDAPSQFFLKISIPRKQLFMFKVRILGNPSTIFIGIVDRLKQKDSQYSHDSGNAVAYRGTGHKFPGN